jgi:RNA polymerase sigma-70 factor (ECF subfamily)
VTLSDTELVSAIARGDRRGEEAFCERFGERIRRKVEHTLAGRPDLEDLASEILQAAFLSVRDGRFRGDSALATFVYAVSKNKIAEYLRRKRPETTEVPETLPSQEPPPDRRVARREASAAVTEALETLPPKHRRVLYLYYFKGLAISEIAAHLQAPPRRVSEWKDYGLKVLRTKCGRALLSVR